MHAAFQFSDSFSFVFFIIERLVLFILTPYKNVNYARRFKNYSKNVTYCFVMTSAEHGKYIFES